MGVLERLIERVEDDLVGHEECGPECWCCQPGRADHAELRKLQAMLMVAKDQASSEALNEAIGKLESLDPLAPAADYIPSLRRLAQVLAAIRGDTSGKRDLTRTIDATFGEAIGVVPMASGYTESAVVLDFSPTHFDRRPA